MKRILPFLAGLFVAASVQAAPNAYWGPGITDTAVTTADAIGPIPSIVDINTPAYSTLYRGVVIHNAEDGTTEFGQWDFYQVGLYRPGDVPQVATIFGTPAKFRLFDIRPGNDGSRMGYWPADMPPPDGDTAMYFYTPDPWAGPGNYRMRISACKYVELTTLPLCTDFSEWVDFTIQIFP